MQFNNYSILKDNAWPNPEDHCWLQDNTELLAAGYNDKFFTSTWTDESGQVWHCCFDIGILLGEKGAFIRRLPQQAKI